MTRLRAEQIASLPDGLADLDRRLRELTGQGIRGIAAAAARPPAPPANARMRRVGSEEADGGVAGYDLDVAVVPITAGQGCIPGFVDAVAAVCSFVGCRCFVTSQTDVAGLAAAAERGAQVILAADDARFVALDLRSGRCIDNGLATGQAYAAALELAARGVAGRSVVVVGLGAVGIAAAARLAEAGALVLAVEHDPARAEVAARSLPIAVLGSLEEGLAMTDLVVDASPALDLIDGSWVTPASIVAAPGIPLGVSETAAQTLGERLIHEPLALGVASMLAQVAAAGDRGGDNRWGGGGSKRGHRPGNRRVMAQRDPR